MNWLLTTIKGIQPILMAASPVLALWKPALVPQLTQIIQLVQKFVEDLQTAIGSSKPKVFQGLTETRKYGDSVIKRLKEIFNSVEITGRMVAEAEELAASLHDRNIIWQPRSGKDLDALNRYKEDADEWLAKIKAKA